MERNWYTLYSLRTVIVAILATPAIIAGTYAASWALERRRRRQELRRELDRALEIAILEMQYLLDAAPDPQAARRGT